MDNDFHTLQEMRNQCSGPTPKDSKWKGFILVAIDYMTRRVEAAATSSIKAKDVTQFVYKNICTRFGVPM